MTKPDDRERILTQTRNLKMARSAHAYVRGSTVKFYDWLKNSRPGELPEGPPVWICGDCHIGNLGPLADAKGHVLIQIRDLDQTVIGNPAHDLIRLGLSLASAARGSDLPGVTTARILEELVAGYLAALTADFQTDKDKSHLPKSIRMLLEQSTRRRWRHLAEAVLDTKARGTHGLKPDVRKRLGQADAHFTWGSSEGRSHRAAGCRLLDEGMQFTWAASLRRDSADRSRKGFEPVHSRRQGRDYRCGPQGVQGGNTAG
jgi:uncharacterized protein (DUF2252 family)